MCPGSINSWCRALVAGNGPARSRMFGKTLVPVESTCRTTSIAAGSSGGRSATSLASASTPPADAPATIRSRCRRVGSWLVDATRRLSHRGPGASGTVLGPAVVLEHEDLDAQIGSFVHRARERDHLPAEHGADRLYELVPHGLLELLALSPHDVGAAVLDQGQLSPREAAAQHGDHRAVEEVRARLGRALAVETLIEPDDRVGNLREQRTLRSLGRVPRVLNQAGQVG